MFLDKLINLKNRLNLFFYIIKYYINYKIYNSNFKKSIHELNILYPTRNDFYQMMFFMYKFSLPPYIREHRDYFTKEKRGFGEDAFHAMWWKIFSEYKPVNILEIGVYRGQVISLWGLLADSLNYDCNICAISPFNSTGDEVSNYSNSINYYQDTKNNIKKFTKQNINLYQYLSTDMEAIKLIKNSTWDLIYIDGSHEFEIALQDYNICKDSLGENGILILDDSSLYTDFNPNFFSFKGHPGPSRVVKEYAELELKQIMSVGHNNVFIKK
jgi:hypothetical protein